MRKASFSVIIAALLLAGCGRPVQNDADDAGNPLEATARERGIVHAGSTEPTGVFERTHDIGRDAMCVVPDGAGQWRFAVTASYGTGLSCAASGRLMREGDGWRLRFAGAEGCEVLVREEEDELRLPGTLPAQCANLCPARASLSGLRLPRASWAEDDARRLQMRDKKGNMILPCGR
ncbi:MAG: hypothetical protein C0520_13630 [Sphingopyxis sp.]|nr:hypothetical protein [Sphingopyxis sp.]